jgi:hypothetical protein
MPDWLIKDLPAELYEKLREQASAHHRSMVQEAITILEHGLGMRRGYTPPPPVQPKVLLTNAMINKAKREGRA